MIHRLEIEVESEERQEFDADVGLGELVSAKEE